MCASRVVGEEEKNGGGGCSPMAKTSIPTSSVFFAMATAAWMRSASLGVSPETGSRVMSLTENTPNCMGTTPWLQLYAFAYTVTPEWSRYSRPRVE
ncbi:hypothetical protein GCM10011600_09550 [Pseudolysinimonas yzui]|uniref:Uncharacterized protein n=1 Tax=Pseudolysinimonas yzui TaxID=2708254 RepID=A0A8J3GP95_9MICO|nr:hypothetical protein GCM10011600_09550 [Pseudolysinimonas yzui]